MSPGPPVGGSEPAHDAAEPRCHPFYIGFVGAGLACVVFFVIYQQVENYVVYPRVMRRTVDVPGAATMIAPPVSTALLGVVEALLAVPTTATVLLVLREVVVRRQDER